MKNKKIQFIIMILIDASLIASYVLGFYFIKYRMPRKLESVNIKVENNRPSKIAPTIDKSKIRESASGLSYQSDNVVINIEKKSKEVKGKIVTYQVADIRVTNVESIKRAFAKDEYGIGYVENVYDIAQRNGAILAINGDYYSYNDDGIVISNGTIYRNTLSDEEICVLFYDGTMEIYRSNDVRLDEIENKGAYQAWSFGPSLMDDEKARVDFSENSYMNGSSPRTAIGYYAPGHYAFVTVDGRNPKISAGVTLNELAAICEEEGMKKAYNLDGGNSSYMYFNGKAANNPVRGGRDVSDIIYIQEAN